MADFYTDYYQLSLRHRNEHGCGAYPCKEGQLLTILAATKNPDRILEVGTALGFSAACLARGNATSQIDTIEFDPVHIRLAQEQLVRYNLSKRVTIIEGNSDAVLPALQPGYDLIFFDGFEPSLRDLEQFHRLAKQDSLLISANLSWSGSAKGYLQRLDKLGWLTHQFGDIALSTRIDTL